MQGQDFTMKKGGTVCAVKGSQYINAGLFIFLHNLWPLCLSPLLVASKNHFPATGSPKHRSKNSSAPSFSLQLTLIPTPEPSIPSGEKLGREGKQSWLAIMSVLPPAPQQQRTPSLCSLHSGSNRIVESSFVSEFFKTLYHSLMRRI